ncbi:Hal1p KNAG_0D02370 [Huiozyma naganishii CBS 8797]|uniref:Uncharacterized protein n=1 Tax=Huiozyma naganishii (strain ATCC MYA-139 / BCRC 22969 / CBS 8797 / KCTC 17520 / NBRC 10181 / NCYC 3082 / Yp74L-3) TaxID=1071383 RepID=J7RY12_HUIN7|nr:hypothetical protein KNAG_0D02370 [Kazachstania naganishii CBS 8797]CCK69987.1 hypothetical protein KNAG_0D02370 [Kazachstania naganishii CBS 8797]
MLSEKSEFQGYSVQHPLCKCNECCVFEAVDKNGNEVILREMYSTGDVARQRNSDDKYIDAFGTSENSTVYVYRSQNFAREGNDYFSYPGSDCNELPTILLRGNALDHLNMGHKTAHGLNTPCARYDNADEKLTFVESVPKRDGMKKCLHSCKNRVRTPVPSSIKSDDSICSPAASFEYIMDDTDSYLFDSSTNGEEDEDEEEGDESESSTGVRKDVAKPNDTILKKPSKFKKFFSFNPKRSPSQLEAIKRKQRFLPGKVSAPIAPVHSILKKGDGTKDDLANGDNTDELHIKIENSSPKIIRSEHHQIRKTPIPPSLQSIANKEGKMQKAQTDSIAQQNQRCEQEDKLTNNTDLDLKMMKSSMLRRRRSVHI